MQEKRLKLQKAIADVIKENRVKSITKSADEIGMGKSIWADLENGIKDPQLSTFWRIAEGLNLKPCQLLKMVEDKIGKDFSFSDDEEALKRLK